MSFKTIITTYGLGKLAAAEVAKTPINLIAMAFGDGNGAEVAPNEAQSALVRERYRIALNRVFQSEGDSSMFCAEAIIPATVGGFALREAGVFDSDGGLVAAANIPETYKPQDSEGAYSDTVVRMWFKVSNASVVTLQVDPSVAVATQSWVTLNITPAALIPGGTTHQVLRKKSNANGDIEWSDPDKVTVVVDMIEEAQTLAAAQTQVDFSTVTTNGLAVYVGGARLTKGTGANQWQANPAKPTTSIILGKAYDAGVTIVGAQNEPAGAVVYPLARDANLSDVPDKAQARANLDLFSKAEARQMAPVGEVAAFATPAAPSGWLKANGAAISRTAYAELFAAIGTTFGAGDGFNTFNLPDLRGEFLRGLDDGRGIDASRAIGSAQAQSERAHYHGVGQFNSTDNDDSLLITRTWSSMGSFTARRLCGDNNSAVSAQISGASGNMPIGTTDPITTGANETRPRNVALLYCIKF